MWNYAVQTVRDALRQDGRGHAEYVAERWEHNCGFCQFKLLRAAQHECLAAEVDS